MEITRGRGHKAKLFVAFGLRKSWHGESERHSEAAKKGWRNREHSSFDLQPVASLEKAKEKFRRLYMRSSRRQPVLNWEDPASPRRLSFVEANIFHAVTKAPVDVGQRLKRLRAELGRRPSKREREELRVFAPERAARMHWVGIVVRDPDRVYEATDREGRAGYLMEGDADPNGYPYVVFLQQSEEDPDDLFFVTAYPYMDEGNAVEDLRLGKLLYKRPGEKVTSPRLRKALGDGASAQLQVIQRPVPPARLRHYTGHVASPGWGITIIPPAGEKSNLLVAFGGK